MFFSFDIVFIDMLCVHDYCYVGFYNIGVYTPIELLEESKINWQVLLKIRRLWLVTTPSVTLDDANVHCIRIDEVGHSPSSVLDWERVLGTTS